jgi:hypothetical protein
MEFIFVEYSIFNILIKYLTYNDFSHLFNVSRLLKKISTKILSQRNPWLLTDLKLKKSSDRLTQKLGLYGAKIFYCVNTMGFKYGIILYKGELFLILRSFHQTERIVPLNQKSTILPIYHSRYIRLPNFLTKNQKEQSFLFFNTTEKSYVINLNKLNRISLQRYDHKDFVNPLSKFSTLLVPDPFCQLLSNLNFLNINDINVPDIIQKGNIFFPDNNKQFFVTNHHQETFTLTIFKVELENRQLIILQKIQIDKVYKPYDFMKNYSYYIYQDYLQLRIYNLETMEKSIFDKSGSSNLIYFGPFCKFVGLLMCHNFHLHILNLESLKIHKVLKCESFWHYCYANKTLFIFDAHDEMHEIKFEI